MSKNKCICVDKGKSIVIQCGKWVSAYEAMLGLNTVAEKRLFRIAFLLLMLYMEFVGYAQNTIYGGNAPVMDILTAVAVIPLCVLGVYLFHMVRFNLGHMQERNGSRKRKSIFCLIVFTITFLYYFAWQRAYWPGSFANDAINQYGQSITGSYNDWHPVLHTWIFFTLPNKIHTGPAMIISMQLVWFSASVTYMLFVLYKCGASGFYLLFSWIYILANPNTSYFILFPWKDSAFSIFSLIVFAQVVQIVMSGGEWLRRWYNLIAFSIFCFLAMNMRHNSVLLVIPLLLVLLVFCKNARTHIFAALGVVIIGTIVLKGPVYNSIGVEEPGGRVLETVGLPMSVLSSIYMNDRESLPPDVRLFMDSLGTEEQWGNYSQGYSGGSFNSVKWSGIDTELIDRQGLPKIMEYMVRSWQRSPFFAWKGFVLLTRITWSVDGGSGWFSWNQIVDNPYGISYHDQDQRLLREFSAYSTRAKNYITKYFFQYVGIIIAILLFMAVANIGEGRLGRVCLVLPLMAYNFGTMLLLSGADDRLFHLNFVLVIPLIFLIGNYSKKVGRHRDVLAEES